jgi:hypothetical protein
MMTNAMVTNTNSGAFRRPVERAVSIDPEAYSVADDELVDKMVELLNGTPSPYTAFIKNSSDDPHEQLMATAKLIMAVGFKAKERARIRMGAEELGAGQFDQDLIDINSFSDRIEAAEQVYDDDERAELDDSYRYFSTRRDGFRKYKTGTELYSADMCADGRVVLAHVVTKVRAPILKTLGYLCGMAPQYANATNMKKETGVGKILVVERRSDHNHVFKTIVKLPYPLDNREVLVRTLWRKLDEDTFLVSTNTCDHSSVPLRAGVVRVKGLRTLILTRRSPELTEVEIKGSIDLCGNFPANINRIVTRPLSMAGAKNLIEFMAATRNHYDEGDAEELGQVLFLNLFKLRTHSGTMREELEEMIRRFSVLRLAQAKYRLIDELLLHVLQNRLKKGAAQANYNVSSPLAALTANEASRVGKSLAVVLLGNATAEAAVDEYLHKFPALTDMAEEFSWFKPMLTAITRCLLKEVAWGVKLRAAIGAGLSLLDMMSDTVMIRNLFMTGQSEFAYPMIVMIGANIGVQLLIAVVQNVGLKKDRAKSLAVDMLSIVTLTKPGLDVWRVASGADQKEGAPLPPLSEMFVGRASEVVCEAIPAMVLQVMALLRAKEKTTTAVVSVFISAASAGMTGASMFFDLDVDPDLRKGNPAWVGLVPDVDRGLAFANAFVICTVQILAKGVATALLATTNLSWLRSYVIGDLGLYLLYRVVRRDFFVFLQGGLGISVVVSFVVRVIEKLLVDYTGTPHIRLPLHMGGLYYSFSLTLSQVSLLAAVALYNEYAVAAPGQGGKFPAPQLWRAAASLAAVWLAAYAFFVARVVKPSHRFTLWSSKTGKQLVQDQFSKGEHDEVRIRVFNKNKLLWEKDIGEAVRKWSLERWPGWEAERPRWFTEQVVATVPDAYIPVAYLRGLGLNRKRKGSAAGFVDLKESARRLSAGGGGL